MKCVSTLTFDGHGSEELKMMDRQTDDRKKKKSTSKN